MSQLKEKIANLSDEDLIIMLKVNADDYIEEAISIAKRELKKRKISENEVEEILHNIPAVKKQEIEKKALLSKKREYEKKAEIRNYKQVPFYRRQWFFWLMFVTFNIVAFIILATGDVYYRKKGEVSSFGLVNRLIAMVIVTVFFITMLRSCSVIMS